VEARFAVSVCFFFQAEDGIRDWSVTGVQTCALPILPVFLDLHTGPVLLVGAGELAHAKLRVLVAAGARIRWHATSAGHDVHGLRSEERRVGKEGRARGGGDHEEERRGRSVEVREAT